MEVVEMKLYDYPESPNAYKARLMLSLLDLEYERETIDLFEGEQHEEEYRAINPRGEVPALIDGEVTLWDSQAILTYLAREYDQKDYWLPSDATTLGRVMQWVALSAHEIRQGIAHTMAIMVRNMPGDLDQTREIAHDALRILEGRLESHDWLGTDHPTVADVICYPWVDAAPEVDISLGDYAGIRRWIEDVKDLPGYEPRS